jgi:hypothetical protein
LESHHGAEAKTGGQEGGAEAERKIQEIKKSQHDWVRWALREHLTPPCSDFACGRLEDYNQTNIKYLKKHLFLQLYLSFKNEKVRKKKESPPLNSSIPRIFATETTCCEANPWNKINFGKGGGDGQIYMNAYIVFWPPRKGTDGHTEVQEVDAHLKIRGEEENGIVRVRTEEKLEVVRSEEQKETKFMLMLTS